MHHPFISSRFASVVALSLSVLSAPASAALFLDTTGASPLAFSDADDGAEQVPFWFDAGYFGQSVLDNATISVNGHLRFGNGSSNDYDPTFLGTTAVNRVAPMWMDFNLGSGGQILTQTGAADAYLAVSWLNMENANHPGALANFQAILFNSATVLNGVSFQAGDIVFSYGDISIYYAETFGNPETTQTTVGLENASGAFATIPGHEMVTGWHSYEAFGDFPVGEDQYLLFRPDGGAYDVGIETAAIPEPSAFAALVGVFALSGACARRRRR